MSFRDRNRRSPESERQFQPNWPSDPGYDQKPS